MSQLSQLLLEKAEEIRMSSATEVAVGLLKEAGIKEEDARYQIAQHELEKEACAQLTMSGVDIESATAMVKASGINVRELTNFQLEDDVHPSVELLKQAALYIEGLESELTLLKEAAVQKEQANEIFSEVELPPQIVKAASTGAFTNEDLEALKKMDNEVLEKFAAAMEPAWEMGQASGFSRPQTDPFLEFLVG